MKEAAELATATADYQAAPLEENLFEWHFTVRGPGDTDFQGGVYHGRILVPTEYPMKPPDIIVNTPNGRFEVGKKICLSISGHHPETWQPSWSIRTALLAIIGFMPSPAQGTIGSLDYTPEERRALAKRSVSWSCPTCGPAAGLLAAEEQEQGQGAQGHRQEVEEIVKTLQMKGEEEKGKDEVKEDEKVKEAEAEDADAAPPTAAPLAAPAASTGATTTSTSSSATTATGATGATTASSSATTSAGATGDGATTSSATTPAGATLAGGTPAGGTPAGDTPASAAPASAAPAAPPRPRRVRPSPARQQESRGIQMYDLCIVLLVAAIAALLYRRLGGLQTGDGGVGGV